MSFSMLKQNVELLIEVSKKYQELFNKSEISASGAEVKKIGEALEKFKVYIRFLTSNIEQLIREEKEIITK